MITFSRIKRILQSCAFKPTDQPFKIIADVGNSTYYQQRACELVKEEEGRSKNTACIPNLKKAISLLALAVAEIELKQSAPEECDRDVTCC